MFIQMNHKEVTQLPTDHNGVSTMNESMSHQTHGVTKWCWRDKSINRLQ